VLEEFGIAVEKPKNGSHWKAKANGKSYPVPAHNGPKSEISDAYINGLCRAFDLDVEDFKSRL